MAKRRLKFTRSGWLVHWLTMRTGTKSWITGEEYPDQYGLLWREFWIGPFPAAKQALKAIPHG